MDKPLSRLNFPSVVDGQPSVKKDIRDIRINPISRVILLGQVTSTLLSGKETTLHRWYYLSDQIDKQTYLKRMYSKTDTANMP